MDFTFFSTDSPGIQINNLDEIMVDTTGEFNIIAVLKLDTAASNYVCLDNKTSTIGLRFQFRRPSYSMCPS